MSILREALWYQCVETETWRKALTIDTYFFSRHSLCQVSISICLYCRDLHFYLFHNGQIYIICLLSYNKFWLQSKVLLKMMLDQLELLMFYLEQNPWREEGDFDSMFRWLVDLPVQDVLNIGSSNLIMKCGRTISKFNLSIPWTFNMIFKENSITRIHWNLKLQVFMWPLFFFFLSYKFLAFLQCSFNVISDEDVTKKLSTLFCRWGKSF